MAILSRFVSLKGFNKVIAGRDLNNILKEGVVYGIEEWSGVIMLRELGPAAEPQPKGGTLGQIMTTGSHLLTEEEAKLEGKYKYQGE